MPLIQQEDERGGLLLLFKLKGPMTAKATDECYPMLEAMRDEFMLTRFGPYKDGTSVYQITPDGEAELERLAAAADTNRQEAERT